jgi:menaquinone-specific isochorismate synthase
VRTVEISDPAFGLAGSLGLLSRLPAEGDVLAWVRDGNGLVGWGEAARFTASGQERFARAHRWWRDLVRSADVADDVNLPGTGPVAFASFTFDPDTEGSVLIVPRVLLGRRDDRTWLTVIGDDVDAVLRDLAKPVAAPQHHGQAHWSDGSRSPSEWVAIVADAVSRINAGEVDKVVLARDVIATTDRQVDPRQLLQQLANGYPECWTFSVDGLIGATPEMLVRREGDRVLSRVLAGTVRRTDDTDIDGRLAAALLRSHKDLDEHEYAVRSVAQALGVHCTDLDVPTHPRILTLPNVQHLATDVRGVLADGAPALALAAALHPTAAVCGTPTERARALISEIEGLDRGRYAGPVGWIDADGDGELGIALRCAEVSGNTIRAFAGCGIVAGSEPAAELAESQVKLVAIRDAVES